MLETQVERAYSWRISTAQHTNTKRVSERGGRATQRDCDVGRIDDDWHWQLAGLDGWPFVCGAEWWDWCVIARAAIVEASVSVSRRYTIDHRRRRRQQR